MTVINNNPGVVPLCPHSRPSSRRSPRTSREAHSGWEEGSFSSAHTAERCWDSALSGIHSQGDWG